MARSTCPERNAPGTARLLALSLALAALAAFGQEVTWRKVDPANLVHMTLDQGTVVIELNPRFAPKTVARFKRLVEEDFYRGLSFYRVIDGFVAQGGDESDIEGPGPDAEPTLPAEFEREWDKELPWTRVEKQDMFRAETGFIDGFAAARERQRVWLTHCPGVIAMARGDEPDTGRTDFYIVIGQAPRYLDRNLTIFGRVIHGMEVVQRIHRGELRDNGIIASDLERTRILRMRFSEDLDAEDRRDYYVMETTGPEFRQYLQARRNRDDRFFHHRPPRVLDVCQVPIATRVEK
ncbi:MAG: peptidylprolyl isomerase [Xanthomonadales bacterium]|nr:peptidylprolyl isomerase [Xanthomonadales bacterium]NIN58819.1 peptidylprolyl isomerase [Xanthomonadales bacterium]NIN74087.1 peptidylprolyl isomerase [Xanthomonadales bacterium]NIO14620.1 peptidylprolyl isomerase [Xanthomonadales bacterium]NIP11212.1 peptidylprolyl isomerase [Xanthomonadales bacterium]